MCLRINLMKLHERVCIWNLTFVLNLKMFHKVCSHDLLTVFQLTAINPTDTSFS